jgi:hypothetical protein
MKPIIGLWLAQAKQEALPYLNRIKTKVDHNEHQFIFNIGNVTATTTTTLPLTRLLFLSVTIG